MLSLKAQALMIIAIQKQDTMTQTNATCDNADSLSLEGVDLIFQLVSSLQ